MADTSDTDAENRCTPARSTLAIVMTRNLHTNLLTPDTHAHLSSGKYPASTKNVRLDTLQETIIFIRCDQPKLLHWVGLIDYEVKCRIIAIGDVILSRGGDRKGGGGREAEMGQEAWGK